MSVGLQAERVGQLESTSHPYLQSFESFLELLQQNRDISQNDY